MDYPVTREWEHTTENDTVGVAFVYLVPRGETDPADPYGRYTIYTATPEGSGQTVRATRKGAMRDVEKVTQDMDSRAGWTRTK